MQGQPDGSNEAGAQEIPAITVTKSIAADIAAGYTLNVHNGDLAYAECAVPGLVRSMCTGLHALHEQHDNGRSITLFGACAVGLQLTGISTASR